jgi:hypothetical protein
MNNDPIFNAVLSADRRDTFVKLLSYVSTYSDVATFRSSESGVSIQSTNSSHTVMVFAQINSAFFNTFKGFGQISCSVKPLVSVLKLVQTLDTFCIFYEGAKIYIEGGEEQYCIHTMDVDTEVFEIPEEQILDMHAVTFPDDPNMLTLFSLLKSWQGLFGPPSIIIEIDPDESRLSLEMESDTVNATKSLKATINGPFFQTKVTTLYIVETNKLKLKQRCIGYGKNFPLLIGDRGEHVWVRTFIAPLQG